jgi:hypothetical protein
MASTNIKYLVRSRGGYLVATTTAKPTIIEAVGDKVKNFAFGDEVLATFMPGDRGGSYQKFAVVEETMVAKKPTTWSFDEAATLGYLSSFPSFANPFLFVLLQVSYVENLLA